MKCAPILIVEDDESLRFLCRTLLEAEGYAVDTAVNGEEALALLEKYQAPCLILLDMIMPIMNGKEFMTAFSKRPNTIVPIPVYLVSATANQSESKKMGCLGFLKKPFDIEVLLAIVRGHCKAA